MIKLKDGLLIQEQFTTYALDSAPPMREGDYARIRLSTGQLVEVTLRKGPERKMWLVSYPGSARDYTPRPETMRLKTHREERETLRGGRTYLQRQNELAAKTAAVLAAKRAAVLEAKRAVVEL